VRDPEEVDRSTARFEHFCRLVVRDRWPYCAINGVLLLVPFAAMDEKQDALDTGATIRQDLSVARRVLQVNAPTLALVCDVESATGFSSFLARFNESERKRRVGQRCPLVPHLPGRSGRSQEAEAARELMFESLSRWLCTSVVPGWIYKNFDMEAATEKVAERSLVRTARGEGNAAAAGGGRPAVATASSERSASVRTNAQLFLFMQELWERQHRLGQLLAKGLEPTDGEPVLFGGCYLGGTGGEAQREQAFVPGVFKRLSEEENFVSWTAQAQAEEESVQRWIGISQVILGILALALLGLLGYMILLAPKPGTR
jgi:type VI protein secretion system component VasK